ncbi:hypothetical protein GWI34_10820 [Actinomadura sp. DSM 109109]|nr:hypothetical protein [Actinomadura lepetitiana]
MTVETGLRLTERYRLVERLDDGAALKVWRAWDELLDRPVTVKVLASTGAAEHRRFQRAVNRAAALSHAALETVFDSDQTRDDSGRLASFVVTEFLTGETLTARLRRGPLPPAEAATVRREVAGALKAAHAAGVTHGDLGPDKILLVYGSPGVNVKVVDTGIGGPGTPDTDMRALDGIMTACASPEDAPPPRRHHARLAALALVTAIPVTAAAAVLLSAPRTPVTAPAPARTDAAPTFRTAPPNAPRVTEALGRLRPIVSRGYATGEIRSDVAIDLDNVITNLENDLGSDRDVDVDVRLAELRAKIVTRQRERGLSPGLAGELTRVLATAQA